jgi:probable HAF family extracellular repeat protein
VLAVFISAALSSCSGGSSGGSANRALPPTNPVSSGGGPNFSVSLPAHYAVIDLGVNVTPTAINNLNQVVGSASNQAFLYSNGSMKMLGILPGDTNSSALDINDSGTIVGDSASSAGEHAVVFAPGGLRELPITPDFELTGYGEAIGVNAGNTILVAPQIDALTCDPRDGGAFLYDITGNGPYILGGGTRPAAINNSGQVAFTAVNGEETCRDGERVPMLYPGDVTIPFPPNGSVGDSPKEIPPTYATGLNNEGDVIGTYPVSNCNPPEVPCDLGFTIEGFVYHAGSSTEIAAPNDLNTQPNALNDLGWAVGNAPFTGIPAVVRGFIWSSGHFIFLNTMLAASCQNWIINTAADVNNQGYIVGTGTYNGQEHGVILKPST